MKEQRENPRAGARGRTKRFLVAVIAIVLAFAFSTTALAAGKNGGSKQTNQPDAVSGATKKNSSNKPDEKPKAKIGAPELDKIAAAIAALSDETLKASLTALLQAYQDAWSAKQDAIAANQKDSLAALTSAITSAKAALDAALETAGISRDSINGVPVAALDGSGHTNRRPILDTEKILAAIAAMPDTNADKSTLTGLLNTYQEALKTMLAANTANMGEEEMLTLSFALRQAEEALLLASREAGLIGGLGRGQFVSGYAFGKTELDVTSIYASIAALDDTDANKATLTTLFEAYLAALEAETTADKTALSQEAYAALSAAAKTAELALIDALEAAGIDVPMLLDDTTSKYTSSSDDDDEDDEHESEEHESEEDDD